jgi:hypothetical protein
MLGWWALSRRSHPLIAQCRPRSGRWLASLVLAGALGAAGCSPGPPSNGVAGQAPATIFSTAMRELRSARSVHFNGQLTSGAGLAEVDATIFADGDVTATFSDTSGATAQGIKVGGEDYVRASAAYWRDLGLTAQGARSVAGRWVSILDSSTNFGSTLALAAIAEAASDHLSGWTSGSSGNYIGQPSIYIATGNGHGGVYVATTGPAYPVAIVGESPSGDDDRIVFGSWNQASPLPTPPSGADLHHVGSLDWPILLTLSQVVL